MPSISRTIGPILLLASPTCLLAQTQPPNANWQYPSYGQPFAARTGQAFAAPTGRPSSAVVPAAYQSPSTPGNPPPGIGPTSPAQAQPAQAHAPAPVPLKPPASKSPIPLKRAGDSEGTQGSRLGGLPSMVTVAGSLGVVLGIFFLVAWGMRRAAPIGATLLPGEVFEILGRAPMAGRQQVYLLRCGVKLVLVSVTPAGAETLTEITEAAEVDRLAGLCQQARPNSATAVFRQVFQQFTQPHPSREVTREIQRTRQPVGATRMPSGHHGLENLDG